MNKIETKRKRIEWAVKILGLGLVGFLVGPFILITIQGLLGLAAAVIISALLINFLPWFGFKLANWRLKSLKAEANANPIETLENQYQERLSALAVFRDNIQAFHAEVQNFYAELQQFKEQHPDGSPQMEAQYNKMRLLLDARGNKYKQARANLLQFEEVIDRKRSEWKLAQAAAKMTKAAGVGEDFISKLMADTAVTSITTSLNTAFAELEVSLLDEQQPIDARPTPAKQLPEQAGPPTLDLDFVVEAEPVAVEKK